MSTDSFVVQPLFFPGGSIGALAVNGTVNDLAVSGAEPKFLSASFILEEGFPLAQLAAIVHAMADAAAHGRGAASLPATPRLSSAGMATAATSTRPAWGNCGRASTLAHIARRPGDAILVSGTIGDHGMAIMSVREGLEFESQIRSDCAALNGMIAERARCGRADVHAMRDPTRGGLASTLNEIATASDVGMDIDEPKHARAHRSAVGVRVAGPRSRLCRQRGQGVFFVAPESADRVLAVLQAHPLGRDAATIGHVTASIRDAGGAHGHGRKPRDRHSDRRAVAEDLLNKKSEQLLACKPCPRSKT